MVSAPEEDLPLALELDFAEATNAIDVRLWEHTQEAGRAAAPLHLKFEYHPETPFAPIREVTDDRNERIKAFYWALWGLDIHGKACDGLNAEDDFVGEDVAIKAEDIEQFCKVIGNDQNAYKGPKPQVPLDFAIKLGWKSIMQTIFPRSIDGDLLKLVHLSNGFRRIAGAPDLNVGDRVNTTSRIISVVNSDSGKTVGVKGTLLLLRDGARIPVIEVESSFLYRGHFDDYSSTFERRTELAYQVELKSEADIAVLRSKEWFDWNDNGRPLLPGTTLVFRPESEYRFKTKDVYTSVTVSGHITLASTETRGIEHAARVAQVNYASDGLTFGNPVLAYLQLHGKALEQVVPLEKPHSLTSASSPSTFVARSSNQAYSTVSGDVNPIHTNPYFSDLAGLPGTITHGMWTSAATRRVVEQIAAQNHPERVVSYHANFIAMVLPGSTLQVDLRHVGMHLGNIVVEISTVDVVTGIKVLAGTAEIMQAPTAYVFTGQGSQEVGMGMALYAQSEIARRVWDEADAHLGDTYGFSILDIVRRNPKSHTVHFGGIRGQIIRERYQKLKYSSVTENGFIKEMDLFPEITDRSSRFDFESPNGLLFATQFAQIALVLIEKAAFEDLKSRSLVQPDCPFAGHSLGEYAALASIANVLPVAALVDVVFYRGLTMQRAVQRDAQNRSNYGMCAVNPTRIGKNFSETALRTVVDLIGQRTDTLLQIVNYNIEGQQYVVAGENIALQTMGNVLNFIKLQKVDVPKLLKTMSQEEVLQKFGEIVDEVWKDSKAKQAADGFTTVERGFSTIPLPGIDVPFHSRYLWAGVSPFRNYLSRKINVADLRPELLEGRYIPNLTAKPFEISKAYAQEIFDQTESPRLEKVLKAWDEERWYQEENRTKLGWIETQDRFFSEYNIQRLVELGPSATLAGMGKRTLTLKYDIKDLATGFKREMLAVAKDLDAIYYRVDEPVEEPSTTEAVPEPTPHPAVTGQIGTAVTVAGPGAHDTPVDLIPDEPLRAIDTIRAIIAQKLKKQIGEIPLTKAVKDLVGGKSTLQNEILGDLQAEFGSAPDKGEEMPLDELGSALNAGYSGTLGKHTNGLVSRMVGSKLPGGFGLSAVKTHLSKRWGLGPGRTDGVMLVGLTQEPAKRVASETEAKAWLDSIVQAYAGQTGITLSAETSERKSGTSGGGIAISSEALDALAADQRSFAKNLRNVYNGYLGEDEREGHRIAEMRKDSMGALQLRYDAVLREHGENYLDGILPVFDPLKARHFNSTWNWVRQDALDMFFDIIFGRLTTVDRDITARCLVIMNRADQTLVEYMRYHLNKVDPARGENYALAKEFGNTLLENCVEVLNTAPIYKDVTFPTAPKTTVTPDGDVKYDEIARAKITRLEKYVQEMALGSSISHQVNLDKLHSTVDTLYKLVGAQPNISKQHKDAVRSLYTEVRRSMGRTPSSHIRTGTRSRRPSNQFLRPLSVPQPIELPEAKIPLLHLKRKIGTEWQYSAKLTTLYLDVLKEIATAGTTFEAKNALLTGVGRGSIGVEILKGLLAGGAKVVVTTSRYSRSVVEYYQGIYQEVGSRGSQLTVVPWNGASKQDVESLIDYIYRSKSDGGLDYDIDYILPFAALPENGREIDGIDDKSELAHRIMLTNLIRLLGSVKSKKASRRFITRPTQVLLPLSPNHGLFGNDGLYSESKIGLETLFNRWNSESWGDYLCLAGAVIGWTRGTGLMSATNTVAAGVEALGCRTFSAKEMAFNILGLMHPLLFDVTQCEPVWADFNGGMGTIPDLHLLTAKIRNEINETAIVRKAITLDNSREFAVVKGSAAERVLKFSNVEITPRAHFQVPFPDVKSYDSLSMTDEAKLRGDMVDLDKVIVVTGFAEVGPFGSARTRWEMEARGVYSIEGLLELAFITGLIKHHNGQLKSGATYVGWIDAKSGEPIDDKDVRSKYEKHILEHTGVRLIEPDLFDGYDPKRKGFTQEIELQHDLEPIEASVSDAERFKLEHGIKVDTWFDGDRTFVKFKKGAKIIIPKAIAFDRLVAGQIPTGWDARVFGIPEDIVRQVDRTALWALVCVAEALMMSGITDPYELYKFVHPSQVGSALGSGMGGMQSLSKMFRDRRAEQDVQNDILQETFINTVAGWVNLLLLSASGPIKIPVGACATALQSVDIACDTILAGKAKVMIAGGFDDFSEEGSYEFANMKATSDTVKEFSSGREPNEMSRPTTSTRAGFMESQGCGVQVLMSATTALEMGATIYGIVGYTATATDKAGRSVPAPGRGILGTARQVSSKMPPMLLNLDYRKRQLAFRRKQIKEWLDHESELLKADLQVSSVADNCPGEPSAAEKFSSLEKEAKRQEKEALATFGMLNGDDPTIAPLRRGLAVWNLTIDDVGVASFHGTSTKANDKNESSCFHMQFDHLGRTKGNACPVIAQKWLTGHPKGGAAAWMMNGVIQTVLSGLIPGNRNNDNCAEEMQEFHHLVYPSRSIQTDGIKVGFLKSFGFGQVGGECVIIHPDVLLASLDEAKLSAYRAKNDARRAPAYRKFNDMFVDNNLVVLKESPPYTPELESKVLLNPLARAEALSKGSFGFNSESIPQSVPVDAGHLAAAKTMLQQATGTLGVGTDIELVSSVPSDSATFVERNYTPDETAYCRSTADPRASFAGRWAAKEAVFKSLHVEGNGAGAPLKDIEIVASGTGPRVVLHGDAASAAQARGIGRFEISLSHADGVAVACVVAKAA